MSLSVSLLDHQGDPIIKAYINSFRQRIQSTLDGIYKMALNLESKVENPESKKDVVEKPPTPTFTNLNPMVSYMFGRSIRQTYKHKKFIIDVATLNHRRLIVLHLTRSILGRLIYNARHAAKMLDPTTHYSSFNILDSTKEISTFPKFKHGTYGTLEEGDDIVYVDRKPEVGNITHKIQKVLIYRERDFIYYFYNAYLPFLTHTCDACGAYAPGKCRACSYRYCSNACYQARPDQHTLSKCPL